jgi:hypothetical protein
MPDNNPASKAVGETAPLVLVLCADPKESGDQDQQRLLSARCRLGHAAADAGCSCRGAWYLLGGLVR